MKFKAILILVLMLLVALFSVQNAEMITVRFLSWRFAMSQALVILLAAFCGALGGLALGTLSRLRRSSDRNKSESLTPPDVS
jgi:uncharacterized integral membrane protein